MQILWSHWPEELPSDFMPPEFALQHSPWARRRASHHRQQSPAQPEGELSASAKFVNTAHFRKKILAAYFSDGNELYFCPLTSCSIQKEKRVPSVCETSVPVFPKSFSESSAGHPGLWGVCRPQNEDFCSGGAQCSEDRSDNVHTSLACASCSYSAFQLVLLAMGSVNGFMQFLYRLYSILTAKAATIEVSF